MPCALSDLSDLSDLPARSIGYALSEAREPDRATADLHDCGTMPPRRKEYGVSRTD